MNKILAVDSLHSLNENESTKEQIAIKFFFSTETLLLYRCAIYEYIVRLKRWILHLFSKFSLQLLSLAILLTDCNHEMYGNTGFTFIKIY